MIVISNGPGHSQDTVYNDDEFEYTLNEIYKRYVRALNAKPSKGDIVDIDGIIDSACDVPWLLNVVKSFNKENQDLTERLDEVEFRMQGLEY